jgi:hypothetical protein
MKTINQTVSPFTPKQAYIKNSFEDGKNGLFKDGKTWTELFFIKLMGVR